MSYQSTDLTVKHSKETVAYGRGGELKQLGTSVCVDYDKNVWLQPISRKGTTSESVRLSIPIDDIPAVLDAIEKVYEIEMSRRRVLQALREWAVRADETELRMNGQDAITLMLHQPETHKELALLTGEAWATKNGKEVLAIIKQAKHKQTF